MSSIQPAQHKSPLVPSLFKTIRSGYSLGMLSKDVSAGITVGVVALPLALAFAIASGLTPERGLYTSIIAGFFMAFFSGSRFPVSGPTGAFVVTEELGSLAMLGASLEVRVTPRDKADDPLGPYGRDDIAFLFTPFEGSPQLPMGKSASGGELSRLMLALELVAADTRGGADQTFIFDEVDAGVGGKAAVELGKRLARLARSAQVIVVTHLAQVASWADAQFVVTKEPPDADDDDLGVVTTIAEVNGETRVHEIARMLSGSESEASLDHARELLKESVL